MNLSQPFVQRPVATALLMVALLPTGAVAYRLLPVSALPQGASFSTSTPTTSCILTN